MWLLPSRGRPDNTKRLAEWAPGAPIVLWLSSDDSELERYRAETWPKAWRVVEGSSGLRLAQILNAFYMRERSLPYYGFIGDDVLPEPADWWKVLAEAAGDWYFAYPSDSVWGGRLSPHFCIGGELVRAAGRMVLPKVRHSFLDTAWWSVADTLGVARYRPEVTFRHLHPIAGEAEMDLVYARGQETYAADERAFNRWRVEGADLKRLRGALDDAGVLGDNMPESAA